jgi:TetR/AcrR family transcriptional regulator
VNRNEKNEITRNRILDSAIKEFAINGYDGASMNSICSGNGVSKGIIYHYFKDKDELYLTCVEICFNQLTQYLEGIAKTLEGTAEQQLQKYFDSRLGFFADNKELLGIFSSASFWPPEKLRSRISELKRGFNQLNISVLKSLLEGSALRKRLSIESVVGDFVMYMDYFNLHFQSELSEGLSEERIIRRHELICHRQLDILLHGVLEH